MKAAAGSLRDRAVAASFGDRVAAASLGDRAVAASLRDRAVATSFGDRAVAASLGDRAVAASLGDRAVATSFGDRAAAASLRDRAAGYFVAPRAPAAPEAVGVAPRAATALPMRFAPRVAVLGAVAASGPVAGALANALRAAHHAPVAAVATWAPRSAAAPDRPSLALATAPCTGSPQARSVAAATASPQARSAPATPAALRLAARLTTRGLPAAARGRLAWLRLADHPVAAALATRRLSGALEVPLVVALSGPRTDVLEGLLREQDLVVVVACDPEGALARLALAGCEVAAVACAPLPAGPARLLALAGLAGARTLDAPLRAAVGRLTEPPPARPLATRAPTADPARSDW